MIAIALALITKEVYSSLFIRILVGGLLYSNFSFEERSAMSFLDRIVASLSDSYNVGILIFLVILGAMVCLMNRAKRLCRLWPVGPDPHQVPGRGPADLSGAGMPDLH